MALAGVAFLGTVILSFALLVYGGFYGLGMIAKNIRPADDAGFGWLVAFATPVSLSIFLVVSLIVAFPVSAAAYRNLTDLTSHPRDLE